MNFTPHTSSGFSYVKFAVLMGLLAILFFIMLPGHKDQSIRSKVENGLSQVSTAQKAVAETCLKNEDAVVSRNSQASYAFFETMYLADVQVEADCRVGTMAVRVKMQNTGSAVNPEFLLSGAVVDWADGATMASDRVKWSCALAKGEPSHAPGNCQRLAERDGRTSFADT
jgi:hypothetical protein